VSNVYVLCFEVMHCTFTAMFYTQATKTTAICDAGLFFVRTIVLTMIQFTSTIILTTRLCPRLVYFCEMIARLLVSSVCPSELQLTCLVTYDITVWNAIPWGFFSWVAGMPVSHSGLKTLLTWSISRKLSWLKNQND